MKASQKYTNGLNEKINKIAEWALLPLAIFLSYNPVNYILFPFFIALKFLRTLNRKRQLGIKEWHFSVFLLFIFLGIFGDNFFRFYYIFPNYDKFLHYIIPLGMTYIFMDSNLLKEKYLSIFVTMGLSAIFEVGEYAMDRLLGTRMQGVFLKAMGIMYQNSLDDTMYDFILALLGALTAFIGYLIFKKFRKK